MNKTFTNSGINYIDLFSGIGGFHLGILKAGIKINKSFYSDIDKYANQIYIKHFNNSTALGDVRNIDKKAIYNECGGIGKINLITFGFPCQDLSVAGKGLGFEGSRSSLFFEAIRLVQELQPDYFIFENVKGLLSSSGGKNFEIVLQEIADAGYDGQWQLVNTGWFLPQNRERIYFVGYNRASAKCPPQVFPITGANRKPLEIQSKAGAEQDRLCCKNSQAQRENELSKDRRQSKGRFDTDSDGELKQNNQLKKFIKSDCQGYRVYKTSGASAAINANAGGLGAKTGLYAIPVLTPERKNKRQNGRRFKTDGEPAFTLTTQDQHGIYDGSNIRRLTPTECERLQGFPDGWTEGLSDNQRYKCLGNAVSVPVVEEIIRRLFQQE